MKFVCLGYYNEQDWAKTSESEINAFVDACLSYDDVLRKTGHKVGGEALQSHTAAATVRYQNGKVTVTDGPYAETKEQIGGLMFLEAKDLKEATELISKHPGIKNGPFEIRPIQDMTEMVRESERRRAAGAK